MSRNVTLAQLEDAVRFQADLIGATVRHTSAQVRTLINTSIQHFREEISNDGNTHYLVSYSSTLSTGATSPYSFQVIDLSAISPAIVRTYGLDVTVDGVVHSLAHRPFTERNIWSGPATTGIPRDWAHYQTAKLIIQPAPNSAYAYTLWYLPVLADLSADASTFDGVAGWEDWIIWDVVCRLLIRDQQSAAFGIAKTYRDDVWARIKRQATRVSSAGGAVVGRDTLRGRIPDPLAARKAVMAGGGPPATHSITLAMLAEQTGPVFLGRISGTGDVQAMTTAQSAGILPLFTPSGPGLVPAAGGSSTTKFLSQAGTFETPAGGAGGGTPDGPSGSIQFKGLSGFVGYTGFAVQGSPPSMTVRLPGSLRVTGGTVDVGSGTVRISASGGHFGGGVVEGVASLTSDRIGALSYVLQPGGSGIGNETLANMASGTVKAALTLGAPADVQIPTLAAYMPTFLPARAGLVPTSDGDTTKFFRADGAFAVPPAGAGSPGGPIDSVQFQNSLGAFDGASGITVVGSGAAGSQNGGGAALVFGNRPTGVAGLAGGGLGTIRAGDEFSIFGVNASGVNVRLTRLSPTGNAGLATMASIQWGTVTSNRLYRQHWSVGTGGVMSWEAGATGTTALLSETGMDLSKFHLSAKSITVGSGIVNSELGQMASGTVKASLSTATPTDIPIPTLFAYAPTFTSTRAGIVSPGDGDTSKFLNAAGLFAAPPVGGTPTGIVLGQLNPIATPRILGRVSALSGIPEELTVAQVATMIPEFTASTKGTVPLSGGGLVNFLRADGNFAAPTGFVSTPTGLPNANLAAMPSGTVKANLTGTGAPSDVLIPTLMVHFPTFTANRAGLVPRPGPSVGFFLGDNGTWQTVENASLGSMASGTVKAQLGPAGTPNNVSIATLMAFAPTFTAAKAGFVAPGDGDTGKFLNAGGLFTTPVAAATPGGDSGNVQWNNGGAMAGASAIHALAAGAALGIGPAASVADRGDLRVASGFMLAARNPSGIAQPMLEWSGQTGMLRVGSSALPRMLAEVATGGAFQWGFGGVTSTTAQLTPTGFDIRNFHLTVKSIDTGHINGLPFDFAGLRRVPSLYAGASIPSGIQLWPPRGNPTGGNRFIIPSGSVGAARTITIFPTGGKGGQVIRIERQDSSGFDVTVSTPSPSATTLYVFGSGVRQFADFMFEKPSGATFQLGGSGDLF